MGIYFILQTFPEKALETVRLNDFQEVVSQADVQD